jgi:ankyrin repeat protein
MWRQWTTSDCPCLHFYEAKLCLRKFTLVLFFSEDTPLHKSAGNGHIEICRPLVDSNADVGTSFASMCFLQYTPLHKSAENGHLEICRLLVESKADVALRDRCISSPPSHHLSLTIYLAEMATLHSNGPSTTTKPTLLHTCAASAHRNDALCRLAAVRNKTILFGVAAAGCITFYLPSSLE